MRLNRAHRPPRPSSGRILHQVGRLARRAWSDRLCAKAWNTIPAELRPGDLRLLSRLMQFPSLPVGTPDCCYERVLQDLDLVAGSAGGVPVSIIGAGREVAMDIVHPRVAGIDVHKKIIWVAVRLPGEAPGERKVVATSFKTFWRSLQKMAAWRSWVSRTRRWKAPGC